MTRTTVNFILDTALLIVFVVLCWIECVVRFVFPPTYEADHWLLWGLDLDAWLSVELGVLCVLTMGILLHIMLHWSWVCGVVTNRISKWRGRTIRPDDGSQTLWGVVLLAALLHVVAIAVMAAAWMIQPPR